MLDTAQNGFLSQPAAVAAHSKKAHVCLQPARQLHHPAGRMVSTPLRRDRPPRFAPAASPSRAAQAPRELASLPARPAGCQLHKVAKM